MDGGKPKAEIGMLQSAIEIATSQFKAAYTYSTKESKDPVVGLALLRLATLYQSVGKAKQAGPLFRSALTIFSNTFGIGKHESNQHISYLGGICAVMDNSIPVGIQGRFTAIDVTAPIRQHLSSEAKSHYYQLFINWKAPLMPELPKIYFENALCMIFREECLHDFANLINVPMTREAGAETLPDMLETVIKWQNHFKKLTPGKDLFEELNNATDQSIPRQYLSNFDMSKHINKTQKQIIKQEKKNGHQQPIMAVPEEKLKQLQPEKVIEEGDRPPKTDNMEDKIIEEKVILENYTARVKEYETTKAIVIQQKADVQPTPTNAAEELAQIVSDKLKNGKCFNLYEVMTPRQKNKLLKKLFGNNQQQFDEFVAYLNKLPDWKTASKYLELFFENNGIYQYDRYAIELSDLVYHRYFPAEKETSFLSRFWR